MENLINARDLHVMLESKRKFANWIKCKLQYFKKDIDYCITGVYDYQGNVLIIKGNTIVTSDNQDVKIHKIEYGLTIHCAKKIAMMENTKKGNQVRDYYIKVERERNALLLQSKLPTSFAQALRMLANSEEKKEQIQIELEQKKETLALQEHVIKESKPKIEYYDNVLTATNAFNITTIAKEMGMSAKALNKMLIRDKIIYKTDNHYVLTYKYQNKGYTRTKTFIQVDEYNNQITRINTVWTQLGRQFLHNYINPITYDQN